MQDLTHRSEEEEIMDDFSQSGKVMDQTLKELDNINSWLGGNDVSKSGLKRLLKNTNLKTLHIADLGCGGGDLMVQLLKWGKRRGSEFLLTGIDANPAVVHYAEQNTKAHAQIDYQSINVFDQSFKSQEYDVIHSSLFTHHFRDDQLSLLLSQLIKQVRIGIVINDLHRHTISYYFTKWVIRTLSKSEMVRYDSVLSVARSFKKKELKAILKKAEITNYSLRWMWAFRWQLVIYKN